jgi:predicted PurR-regulated permease PerM
MENEKLKINSDKFLAAFTLALIITSLWIFSPYLHFLIVGGVLALATSHIFSALVQLIQNTKAPAWIKKSKRAIAAAVLTLFFLMMIFTPLLYFVSKTYDQAAGLDIKQVKQTVVDMGQKAAAYLKRFPILQGPLKRLKSEGSSLIKGATIEAMISFAKKLVTSASALFGQMVWILLFYFLFNLYSKEILQFAAALMPMSLAREQYLYRECTGTVAVVFYGTLFNMAAQGLAFGLLMVFIGGYDAFYIGVLTGFCSVVPIVGVALVYIPIIAIELFDGHMINAVLILVFTWVVMGLAIDNILRMLFIGYLKKKFGFQYTMNEILILLSVLAGIATFGFWGLVIGPSVIALTLAAANLYSSDLL